MLFDWLIKVNSQTLYQTWNIIKSKIQIQLYTKMVDGPGY